MCVFYLGLQNSHLSRQLGRSHPSVGQRDDPLRILQRTVPAFQLHLELGNLVEGGGELRRDGLGGGGGVDAEGGGARGGGGEGGEGEDGYGLIKSVGSVKERMEAACALRIGLRSFCKNVPATTCTPPSGT